MDKVIYLDYSATSPMKAEAVEAMQMYFTEEAANPSGIYKSSQNAKKAMEQARCTIAESIGAEPSEIYFTSGGTESDNWALRGIADGIPNEKGHIITTAIEHRAILATCRQLEREGHRVTYLPTDRLGGVDPKTIRQAISSNTRLISVMTANNEIGTVEPIEEIGAIAKESGVLFHTDAVQAYGRILLDVKKCNIDLLSASAHKIGGPKGVGFLYVKRGIAIAPLLFGGGQERGMRSGTENIPGIVGFAKAVQMMQKERETENERLKELRDHMISRVLNEIPGTILTGDAKKRLCFHASFCMENAPGETVLYLLNSEGICASAGSACSVGSGETSHVLAAIGVPYEKRNNALRFTLGNETTREDIDFTVDRLKIITQKVQKMNLR